LERSTEKLQINTWVTDTMSYRPSCRITSLLWVRDV